MYTPYTPLLYSKTGVYKGIHFFLYFSLKHRLWVFVRTASLWRFLHVPTINVLSKNKKNITIFHLKKIFFTAMKKCSILYWFPVNSYSSQFVLILVNSYSKFWSIRTHLVNSYSCLVSSYSFWSIRTNFGQFVLKLK